MRRSKEQILEKILVICKEPSGVTKIIYQCNLNSHTVKLHLECLTDAGLLGIYVADEACQISYRTTPKGMQALEYINAFRPLFMPIANSQGKLVVQEGL
jgi:predicted transcriptional regulator